MKKIIILLLALFAFYKYIFYIPSYDNVSTPYKESVPIDVMKYQAKTKSITYTKNSSETAFKNHFSHVQVEGIGIVSRILRDDTKGSQHQKFIIRLDSGQTLLVAHNIDLAPRLNGLQQAVL